METIDKNRLIAEFMGLARSYAHETDEHGYIQTVDGYAINEYTTVAENSLKYHTSFDWLMPVVEKIEAMGFEVYMQPKQCQIYRMSGNFPADLIVDADFKQSRLDNTIDAVISFIQWYNTQNNPHATN